MTINYTTNLSLAEPVTGTESGTWGDDVNKGLTDYLDIAIAGTLALTSASFTANALTLANTTGNNSSNGITTTTAQYYVLKVSSLTANVTITAPSSSKSYVVVNLDSTYSVTVKASGQTGITVPAGQRALVVFNGTDYVQVGASAGGANTQVQYNSSGALAGSSNFTFNGTTATINTLNLTNALGAAYGGTGVNNGSSTITIGGNVTMSGAYTFTGTLTANTSVTFPTSGTLVNTAVTTLSSLASVGTITTGTWNATAIGISYGGTGQTTASAAFNALSPVTTTGDLIIGNGTNSSTRLGIGTSGYVLTSSGTTASWQPASGAVASGAIYTNTTTISTNYTITSGNNGFSVGPITISSGYAVTVASGQRWVVL